MRHTCLPLAALCCVLVAGGCGSTAAVDAAAPSRSPSSPTSAGAPATATTPTAPLTPTTPANSPTPAPGDTLAAYRYLVHDVTGFLAAGLEAEQQTPDVSPDDPAEVLELVGYDLADGVHLVAWGPKGICFTGPDDTWWSFGEARRDFLRLSLGTGECNGPEPDVVVDVEPSHRSLRHLTTHVRTGEELAAQLPELDEFVRLINGELR